MYRAAGWALFSVALAGALFHFHDARAVLLVALVVLCAYLNAMFSAAPLSALRKRDPKRIFIAAGALAANAAVLFLTDFNLLAAVVVWLPSLAGFLSVAMLRGK
jgi:hypothetical protein